MKIQLADRSEKWLVDIFLKKEQQGKQESGKFLKEIKKAAKEICRELKTTVAPPKDVPDGKNGAEGNPPLPKKPVTIKSRKKRVMAASLLTDEVIFKILKVWLETYHDKKQIDQREFWPILKTASLVSLEINQISILNFLVKKKVIKKIEIVPRHHLLELGSEAFSILESGEKLEKEKEAERKKAELLADLKSFPAKAVSVLETLENLQSLRSSLEEIRAAKTEVLKEILALQEKVNELEKKETECLKEIEKGNEILKTADISNLLKIAETLQADLLPEK